MGGHEIDRPLVSEFGREGHFRSVLIHEHHHGATMTLGDRHVCGQHRLHGLLDRVRGEKVRHRLENPATHASEQRENNNSS